MNAPIKRHRVAKWVRKQDLYICYVQETHLRAKDFHKLRVKGWRKIFHANENEKRKKAGVTILTTDNTDFKMKTK